MGRDARRTLLVLGRDAALFVALRESLESAHLAVRWADSAAARQALRDCVPWPWAIAADEPHVDGAVADLVARRPVLCFWLGNAPALAQAVFTHDTWTAMAADIHDRLHRAVASCRLAPNRGTVLPGGSVVLSPVLEALVAAYPRPLRVPAASLRSVATALVREAAAVRVQRDPDGFASIGAV